MAHLACSVPLRRLLPPLRGPLPRRLLLTPNPQPPLESMAESEDVKPAQQTINLKIKEGDKAAVTFKVKRSIAFSKIFDAFHNKVGAAAGTYKFMRDGNRVEPGETPDSLDMEDDEQIDAIAMQVRGSRGEGRWGWEGARAARLA